VAGVHPLAAGPPLLTSPHAVAGARLSAPPLSAPGHVRTCTPRHPLPPLSGHSHPNRAVQSRQCIGPASPLAMWHPTLGPPLLLSPRRCAPLKRPVAASTLPSSSFFPFPTRHEHHLTPGPAHPLHQIKPPSPPPCCPRATEPCRPCRWPLEFPCHLGTPSCHHLRPSLTSSRCSGEPCSTSPCLACSPSFRGAHVIAASTPRPSASPGDSRHHGYPVCGDRAMRAPGTPPTPWPG
jgi:hypothetical protein